MEDRLPDIDLETMIEYLQDQIDSPKDLTELDYKMLKESLALIAEVNTQAKNSGINSVVLSKGDFILLDHRLFYAPWCRTRKTYRDYFEFRIPGVNFEWDSDLPDKAFGLINQIEVPAETGKHVAVQKPCSSSSDYWNVVFWVVCGVTVFVCAPELIGVAFSIVQGFE